MSSKRNALIQGRELFPVQKKRSAKAAYGYVVHAAAGSPLGKISGPVFADIRGTLLILAACVRVAHTRGHARNVFVVISGPGTTTGMLGKRRQQSDGERTPSAPAKSWRTFFEKGAAAFSKILSLLGVIERLSLVLISSLKRWSRPAMNNG
jgi:hypothetical protein